MPESAGRPGIADFMAPATCQTAERDFAFRAAGSAQAAGCFPLL